MMRNMRGKMARVERSANQSFELGVSADIMKRHFRVKVGGVPYVDVLSDGTILIKNTYDLNKHFRFREAFPLIKFADGNGGKGWRNTSYVQPDTKKCRSPSESLGLILLIAELAIFSPYPVYVRNGLLRELRNRTENDCDFDDALKLGLSNSDYFPVEYWAVQLASKELRIKNPHLKHYILYRSLANKEIEHAFEYHPNLEADFQRTDEVYEAWKTTDEEQFKQWEANDRMLSFPIKAAKPFAMQLAREYKMSQ